MAKRILVIEDEAAIRDLICMNLEVAGYETVVFGDGIEVSEALKKEHKYDCALLDIMLPGKDGFALLPELSGYQIPVIFLTAKGDIQSKIKGLTEGAEDYLCLLYTSFNRCKQRIFHLGGTSYFCGQSGF